MQLNTYQTLAARTAKMYPTLAQNLDHAVLGMCSEYFELNQASTLEEAVEETADIAWYIALAATVMGITLTQALDVNEGVDAHGLQAALPSSLGPGRSLSPYWDRHLGRFTTFVKRVYIYGKEATPEMLAQAQEDIGRLLVLCAAHAERNNFTLAAAMRKNIRKLQERYPDAYSDAAAEARADKGGLDATRS
jgi:NTP pyrophosphatase (non-canonical NTP hydrolase)